MPRKSSGGGDTPAPSDYVDYLGADAGGAWTSGLNSSQAPSPAGLQPDDTHMPVRLHGTLWQVPHQNLAAAIQEGAVPLTPEEWQAHLNEVEKEKQEAALQAEAGDWQHQIDAAAVGAVGSIPLVGPALLSLQSKEWKEYDRKATKANPLTIAAGGALGTGVQLLAGTGEAKVAAKVGQAAAEAATSTEAGLEAIGGAAKAQEGAAALWGSEAAQASAAGARALKTAPSGVAGVAGAAPRLLGAGEQGVQGVAGAAPRLLGAGENVSSVVRPAVQAAEEAAAEVRAAQAGAARAAEAGTGAVEAVAAAPQNLVTKVGELAAEGVKKLLPEEVESLAGKLASSTLTNAAKWGAEGAVYGANDYLNELAIDNDPEFSGEKLLQHLGTGAIFGSALGGLAGFAGKAGEEAIKHLPSMEHLTGQLAVRTILGGRSTKAAQMLEQVGGADAVGRRLLKEGVIGPADNVEQILVKLKDRVADSGAKLGAVRDAAGERVSVGKLLDSFDKEIKTAEKDWAGNVGIASELRGMRDRLAEKLGVDIEAANNAVPQVNEEAIKASVGEEFMKTNGYVERPRPDAEAFGKRYEGVADTEFKNAVFKKISEAHAAREKLVREAQDEAVREAVGKRLDEVANYDNTKKISFSDIAEIRSRLDKKVNWAPRDAMENERQEAFKRVRGHMEDALEEGMGKVSPEHLAYYKAEKIRFRQLKTANKLAEKAAQAKQQNSMTGLAGYAGLAVGSHLSAGPMGLVTGLAGAAAAKAVKDRGMSTAAYLADKVATMAAIRRSSEQVQGQLEKAVNSAMDGKAANLKVPSHGLGSFEERSEAVLAAEKDPKGHLERIQRAVAGILPHAPSTASAFASAALKASVYLASVLPREKPVNPLMPNGPKIPISEHDKFIFNKRFDAVHNPASMVADMGKGTVLPEVVSAVAASSPKTKQHIDKMIMHAMEKETKTPGIRPLISASFVMGMAAHPSLDQPTTHMLQAAFANPQTKGGPPPAKASTGGESRGTPKAARMRVASNTSLDASRFR